MNHNKKNKCQRCGNNHHVADGGILENIGFVCEGCMTHRESIQANARNYVKWTPKTYIPLLA